MRCDQGGFIGVEQMHLYSQLNMAQNTYTKTIIWIYNKAKATICGKHVKMYH